MTTGPKFRKKYADNGWRYYAACAGADPSQFFPYQPARGRNTPARTKQKAQQTIETFCNKCPVQLECFDYAATFDTVGIFGGYFFTYHIKDDRRAKATMRKRLVEKLNAATTE